MKDTAKWLYENFGAGSVREAAKGIGMADHKKLGRWLDTEYAPWVVIELSRFYGKDPVERLYATNMLTADEALTADVTRALKAATDVQLSEEIVDRVRSGEGFHAALTDPIEIREANPDADSPVQIWDEGGDVNPPEGADPEPRRRGRAAPGR